MMNRHQWSVLCLLFLPIAHCQVSDDSIPDFTATRTLNQRQTPDLVSTFLLGFGDLLLDIDAAYSKQTAPKVEAEDRKKEQMYGRPRSGISYANRILENYRDLQRRMGEALGRSNLHMSSDLGSVSVQNKGPKTSVDVSLPFLPMKLSVRSSDIPKKTTDDPAMASEIDPEPKIAARRMELPRFATGLKIGDSEINVDSKKSTLIPDVSVNIGQEKDKMNFEYRLTDDQNSQREKIQMNAENLNGDPKKSRSIRSLKENELYLVNDEYSPRMALTRDPEETDNPEPTGRILGDILYSESKFDKFMKRVIKDTKWALDPSIFPSRVTENLKRASQIASELKKPDTENKIIRKQTEVSDTIRYPKLDRKGDSLKNIRGKSNTAYKNVENFKLELEQLKPTIETEDGIILAFTPDGIPLKLKMDPSDIDPVRLLHESLRFVNAALNIPVVSLEKNTPVGTEILQIGSDKGNMMARALFVDLTDPRIFAAFLETLKKFQNPHSEN